MYRRFTVGFKRDEEVQTPVAATYATVSAFPFFLRLLFIVPNMKHSHILAFIAAATASPSPFKLDFSIHRGAEEQLVKRDEYLDMPLHQPYTKDLYLVNLSIGTPAQHFSLQLDTGVGLSKKHSWELLTAF